MSKKNNSFLGEITDSMIIGAVACDIFKITAVIFKIIGLIVFWPIALLLKTRSK